LLCHYFYVTLLPVKEEVWHHRWPLWAPGFGPCAQGAAAIGVYAKTRHLGRPAALSRISAKFPDIPLAFTANPRMNVVPLKRQAILTSEERSSEFQNP
jgi:hypothetical protein